MDACVKTPRAAHHRQPGQLRSNMCQGHRLLFDGQGHNVRPSGASKERKSISNVSQNALKMLFKSC